MFPFQMPFNFTNQQGADAQQNTCLFKFPQLNLQNIDFQKLLSMNVSPDAMAMLQKVLDFVFDLYNKQCEKMSVQQDSEQEAQQE